jgi:hypothetical protein
MKKQDRRERDMQVKVANELAKQIDDSLVRPVAAGMGRLDSMAARARL